MGKKRTENILDFGDSSIYQTDMDQRMKPNKMLSQPVQNNFFSENENSDTEQINL